MGFTLPYFLHFGICLCDSGWVGSRECIWFRRTKYTIEYLFSVNTIQEEESSKLSKNPNGNNELMIMMGFFALEDNEKKQQQEENNRLMYEEAKSLSNVGM